MVRYDSRARPAAEVDEAGDRLRAACLEFKDLVRGDTGKVIECGRA